MTSIECTVAEILTARAVAGKLDLDRAVFIVYSNGANLIAALNLLHPDLVHRAVLLGAMPVFETTPAADQKGTRFLFVAGKRDKPTAPSPPSPPLCCASTAPLSTPPP